MVAANTVLLLLHPDPEGDEVWVYGTLFTVPESATVAEFYIF
jgi:hypothetical protein